MAKSTQHHSRVDGGYGWIIVFASFLTHFLLLGQVRTFGILYVALLRIFGQSAAKTATLSGCFNTVRMLLAPVVGILCRKASCRASLMFGGVIMLVGLVISAYASSLDFLFVSYGVIAGCGGALAFTPPYIIVAQYFDKKKGIAMSLGTVGAGVGAVVYAPLTAFLLQYYNFSGCMLLMGAFAFHICIAGALLRPFNEKPKMCDQVDVIENTGAKASIYKGPTRKLSWKDEEIVALNPENTSTETSSKPCAVEGTIPAKSKANKRGSCISQDRERYISCSSFLVLKWRSFIKGIKRSGLLFKNTSVLVYCGTVAVMPIAMGMVIFFMADAAVLIGASDTQAALLMSIFGMSDTVGRLGWGFVFDFKIFRHRRKMLYSILGIIAGVLDVCIGFMDTYIGLAIMAGVFGFFAGGFHAQRMTVASEIVSKERLPDIIGISIFFQGLGVLVGLPFGGYVKDRTGNYDWAYRICGVGMSVICGLFLLDYVIKHGREQNTDIQGRGQNAEMHSCGENADMHSRGENADMHSRGENSDMNSRGQNGAMNSRGENADMHSRGENGDMNSLGQNGDMNSRGQNADMNSFRENADHKNGDNTRQYDESLDLRAS